MMMPSNTWSSNSSYILILCHSFEKSHKLEGYLTHRNRKIKIKRCLQKTKDGSNVRKYNKNNYKKVKFVFFFFFYKLHDAQSCPTLHDPMDYTVHGIFQARILDWVAFPFSRRIFPTRGLNPELPHFRQILYQLSHKVQEYGVGSLCPLQCISPTQELNWSLLHCRQILYQLNYQGSPISTKKKKIKFLIKIDHFSTKLL